MDHVLTQESNTHQHALYKVFLGNPALIFTNKAFSRVHYV